MSLTRTKGLRRRSAKKQQEYEESRPVVAEVFERDGGCVLAVTSVAGSCWGPPTPHHIVKAWRSKKGWTHSNLVTLCAHHNGWVEDQPVAARRLGLVADEFADLREAWAAMRTHCLAAGPLTVPCTGPDRTTLHRREIQAGEAACEACGHFQPIIANPDAGGGAVLAPHEVEW